MEEKYLEGIESGADAYITKPFSISLLLARISKLIEQRDKLREKFSNEPGIVHAAICTNNKDSFLNCFQAPLSSITSTALNFIFEHY